MGTRFYRKTTDIARRRRREEIASLLLEGYEAQEIAEYSVYSIDTVKRDIKYIETHQEEFKIITAYL
ncbi:MAG: hypothetical protein HFJ34_04510 [Clostridia bacterium]|nr:hypothetical protein [Clostridia bacterium]